MDTQVCNKCNLEKNVESFYLRKENNRRRLECKECWGKKARAYRSNNKEELNKKQREYQQTHKKERKAYVNLNRKKLNKWSREHYSKYKERFLVIGSAYYQKNKEKRKLYGAEYCKNNKEKIKKAHAEWRSRNKIKVTEYARKYNKERKEKDLNFNITLALRGRLYRAVKNNHKCGSAVKDLGCSIDFFKQHISEKFYPNISTNEEMSWSNYGKKWEIDHIIPLSTLNLSDEKQFYRAVHYTNLQPLWKKDNAEKNNSLTWDWE